MACAAILENNKSMDSPKNQKIKQKQAKKKSPPETLYYTNLI